MPHSLPPRWRSRLLRWYDAHRRDLPWRRTRDPYRIWLSEVMLQQTRVATVLSYYRDFLRRFPSLKALAAAKEREVLTLWSGLGYYRRARALHAAACRLVAGSRFPRTAEGWRELPGIGRYTAAAIASIAFGEAVAVVDGNVERVLRRFLSLPQRADVWETAQSLISRSRPGDYNQALMEMGATVCLPRLPQCPVCPLQSFCRRRGPHPTEAAPPRRSVRVSYALARRDGRVRLVERPADAKLMPLMWELPQASSGQVLLRLRHAITNTDFRVEVIVPDTVRGLEGKWVAIRRVASLPLTGLARKVLRRAGIPP